jgi:hypothetical protein
MLNLTFLTVVKSTEGKMTSASKIIDTCVIFDLYYVSQHHFFRWTKYSFANFVQEAHMKKQSDSEKAQSLLPERSDIYPKWQRTRQHLIEATKQLVAQKRRGCDFDCGHRPQRRNVTRHSL